MGVTDWGTKPLSARAGNAWRTGPGGRQQVNGKTHRVGWDRVVIIKLADRALEK